METPGGRNRRRENLRHPSFPPRGARWRLAKRSELGPCGYTYIPQRCSPRGDENSFASKSKEARGVGHSPASGRMWVVEEPKAGRISSTPKTFSEGKMSGTMPCRDIIDTHGVFRLASHDPRRLDACLPPLCRFLSIPAPERVPKHAYSLPHPRSTPPQ